MAGKLLMGLLSAVTPLRSVGGLFFLTFSSPFSEFALFIWLVQGSSAILPTLSQITIAPFAALLPLCDCSLFVI